MRQRPHPPDRFQPTIERPQPHFSTALRRKIGNQNCRFCFWFGFALQGANPPLRSTTSNCVDLTGAPRAQRTTTRLLLSTIVNSLSDASHYTVSDYPKIRRLVATQSLIAVVRVEQSWRLCGGGFLAHEVKSSRSGVSNALSTLFRSKSKNSTPRTRPGRRIFRPTARTKIVTNP